MPRLIPPRYTPTQVAQLVGAPERLCGGQTVIRIDMIRQNTNNAARRRRHLGRATCEVTGLRFETQGPAPIYRMVTLLWRHGHGGADFEVYDDVSPTGKPGGLAMRGKVLNWSRLVSGKPVFDKDASSEVDFLSYDRDLVAQAAGRVVDLTETESARPENARTAPSRPSGGLDHPRGPDGASTCGVGARTPNAA